MLQLFKNLKLIHKISLGFYLFIAVLALLVTLFYNMSNMMMQETHLNYSRQIQIKALNNKINQSLKELDYLTIKNSLSPVKEYQIKSEKFYKTIYENILILKKDSFFQNRPQALKLIKNITIRARGYFKLSSQLKDDMDEDIQDGIYSILALTNTSTIISQEMQELSDIIDSIAKKNTDALKERLHQIRVKVLVALLIFFIFMLIINHLIVTSMMQNLENLKDLVISFFDYLSNKRETIKHIHFESRDEIAEIVNIIDSNLYVAHELLDQEREEAHIIEERVKEATKEIVALNKEIESTQREVVFTMGAIAEERSKETGNHVKRVAEYSFLLAQLYGLSKEESILLKDASPMHDIGKIAIADAVLKKPGKLTEDEFKIMQSHAEIGYKMLKHSKRSILKTAAIVAYEHHEKYNGKGYPQGLKGEEIHIYGRITAIADVFDALGSERVYKKAWPLEKICKLLEEERGEHFDPDLVDLFLDNLPHFVAARENIEMHGNNEVLSVFIENFEKDKYKYD